MPIDFGNKIIRVGSSARHPVRLIPSFLLSVFSLLSVVNSSQAQTSFPMITHANPVAVQHGKTVDVSVDGQMNFAGCYKALFEGQGITAEVITPGAGTPTPPALTKSVKLKVTVAADAPLGVREFRVAS